MNPKISVIVPVYKVEKYITKCIQSLLDQTYTNFEAIIVNDGSPDESMLIAEKLICNDARFIILNKENGGISSARNLGLDYSTGDYIAFLDSDDSLDKNCFEFCVQTLNTTPLTDIILFGFYEINDLTHKKIGAFLPDIEQYSKEEDILLLSNSINYSVWNKLYKKDLFETNRFTEGLMYEDKELMVKLLYNRKLTLLPLHLYNYIIRKGSLSRSYSKNSLTSYLYIYESFEIFLTEKHIFKKYASEYEKGYISYCFYAEYMHIIKQSPNFSKDIAFLKESINNNITSLKNIKRHFPLLSKQFLAKVIFNINPKILKFIYKISKFKK